MIDGVQIHPLRQIRDDRGAVYHMLRRDDPSFEEFGEIYFSLVHPGVVKGWHIHTKMTLNYAVPVGRIRLVLFDVRKNSPTEGMVQELFVGEEPELYRRVRIPPGIWNGFRGEHVSDSVVANCASIPHDPSEITRIPPGDLSVPYRWPEMPRTSR